MEFYLKKKRWNSSVRFNKGTDIVFGNMYLIEDRLWRGQREGKQEADRLSNEIIGCHSASKE